MNYTTDTLSMLSTLTLDVARTALALGMLAIGSYSDIKTRMVNDRLWIASGAIAALMTVLDLAAGSLTLRQLGVSLGFMAVLCGVLWFFKLMGEADLIAFMVLALIHPRAPVYLLRTRGWLPPFFAFTMISNTAIAGILAPFVTLARNLSQTAKGLNLFEELPELNDFTKISLIFTGSYAETGSIEGPPFQYPLENIEGDVRLHPDFYDDEAAEKQLQALMESGRSRVWVSQTLPYLVVMTVGYILSVVFGDLFFALILFFTK